MGDLEDGFGSGGYLVFEDLADLAVQALAQSQGHFLVEDLANGPLMRAIAGSSDQGGWAGNRFTHGRPAADGYGNIRDELLRQNNMRNEILM